MLLLVKEAVLEGEFCCVLMGTIWMAQQAVLHKDVGKAFILQESSVFQLNQICSILAREYSVFLFISVHHMLVILFFCDNLTVGDSVIGQSSFPVGFSALCI